MNNKTPIQFQDLLEYVQDILLSDESVNANKKIIKEFNLSDEQIDILFDILRKIVFKQIELDQLLKALESLNLGEEQTKKIAVEILKKRVLPLSDYLKVNTLSYIKEWGGDIPVDELSELVKTESQGKINVDNVINQITKETGLELQDDVLKNRFKNIVLSFIRDVRGSTETIIVLKRSSKIGGIGLKEEMVDKIMRVLKKEDQRVQTASFPTKKIINTEKAKALMKLPSQKLLELETKVLKITKEKNDPISLLKKNDKQLLVKKTKKIDIKEEKTAQDVEEVIKKFQPQRISPSPVSALKYQPIKENVEEEIKEKEKLPVVSGKNSPVLSRKLEEPNKTMVGGISNRPKIYGPSDELKSISLVDWRRWGTPQEVISKIKEKIDLLADDSLIKKAEGIKAWKESEINNLYLEIGEESINEGNSIEETIKERQKEDRKTLTEEEFNAVVELNQKLRF